MEKLKDLKGEECSLRFNMPRDEILHIIVTEQNRYYLKCGEKVCSTFTSDECTAYKMAQAAQWAAYNLS